MVLYTVLEVNLLSRVKAKMLLNLQSTDTTPKEDSKQYSNVGGLSQVWKGFFVFTDYIRMQREQGFGFGTSQSSNLHTSEFFGFSCVGGFSSQEFTLCSVNLCIHAHPLDSPYGQKEPFLENGLDSLSI